MITFHPASRQIGNAFFPMITLRGSRGRMAGSQIIQSGAEFATAAEAKAHALIIALRAAMRRPDVLFVAKA